jgi:hypothetical protein
MQRGRVVRSSEDKGATGPFEESRALSFSSRGVEDDEEERMLFSELEREAVEPLPPMLHTSKLLRTSCSERCRIVATRVRNTGTCLVVYLVSLLLNLFVLVWELAGGERRNHWVMISVEVVINTLLLLEVATGLISLGKQYFSTWQNRVDFVVTVFCVLFFIVLLIEEEEKASYAEDTAVSVIDVTLLILRYVIQLGRLIFIAVRGHRTSQFLQQEDVTFSSLNSSSIDLDVIRAEQSVIDSMRRQLRPNEVPLSPESAARDEGTADPATSSAARRSSSEG